MLPVFLWGLSVITGANGFIAAFLAGGIFGQLSVLHHSDHPLSELLESVADFLSDVAWFFAGELLIFAFRKGFHWQWVVIGFFSIDSSADATSVYFFTW